MQKVQKRKICRYYTRGKCVKQDCPFIHQAQTKKPCKFWIQTGFCRKGKNCQFYHATKQQQKKQKKFTQKNKGEQQQKFQRNLIHENKISEQKKKRIEEKQQIDNQIKKQQLQRKQQQKAVDHLETLKIQQQQLKQLTKDQHQQEGHQKLQFFKQFPKNFPDHTKTPEVKEHIKKIQQKFFKNQPFLKFLKELPTKEEQQFYQIIRRYQDSFKLEDDNQPRIYFINMRPLLFNKQMNLHFEFQQSYVQIKINQLGYPQQKAHFQIINKSMPKAYRHKFTQILDKYHSKHNVFQSLKYFQNNFQKNYETVRSKLQNQHFKKLQLKQKIESQKQKIKQIQREQKQKEKEKQKHHNQKHNHHNEHHKHEDKHQVHNNNKNDDDGNNQQKQKQDHKNHQNKKQQLKNQHKNYVNPPPIKPIVIQNPHFLKPQQQDQKPNKQFRDYFQLNFNKHQKPQHQNLNDELTVENLVMQNCPYLVPQKLLLYIQCNCSKVLMYLFDAQERKQLKLWVKLKCKKCNDCIRIVWERQVIHNKGTLISKMSFVNGKLIDIGGVGWKIGCNCDEQILKGKLYLPGQRLQVNCHTCFSNMSILYNGIKHFNPFVKQFQMQEEKQLPLRGSCNHDKYNFRWLRYACCGRPFSCDECHDLGSVKQHQIHEGITMICGYCAHEQTVASQCARCKKQLIKGQDKAGHWQGGMGCRDQVLLSKKDAKKYAGVGKIQSNKKKGKDK